MWYKVGADGTILYKNTLKVKNIQFNVGGGGGGTILQGLDER